ncbi:MAG: hypothetical protein EHM89_19130 [Acidobacteria bacterium]|nr:MAG: hypothetical protein EHM89_19130 [Acidobacteriota bacterium]
MRQHLGYKILALVLAVIIWAKVNSDRNPNIRTVVDNVRVDYRQAPEGFVVTQAPVRIQINAVGPQSALRSLKASQLKAFVDLSEVQVGAQDVPVQVSGPRDVSENVRLSSPDVKIVVEASKRKTLKIDVTLQRIPPLGYTFGAAVADPPAAVVSGRSSFVDRVRRLTVAVSPSAAPSTGEDLYPVLALDADGNEIAGLKIEPARVAAKLELVEAQATKSVIVSPNIIGQPTFPAKVLGVNVSPTVVTIFGRPEGLVSVTTIATDPVDINNATDTITRTVGLRAPSSVRSTNTQTVKVTVRIGQ